MENNIYEIPVKKIDGTETNLGEFKNKVLLVVNVASKCGMTPQYDGLQKIYDRFHEQGFAVVGFPANNFMGQEPGTDAEIQEFCTTKFNVEFPMFSKISVKGADQHPLYQFLTSNKPETDYKTDRAFEKNLEGYGTFRESPSDILWNFEKFLVSKDGQIVARFTPDTTPDDPEVISKIEAELQK